MASTTTLVFWSILSSNFQLFALPERTSFWTKIEYRNPKGISSQSGLEAYFLFVCLVLTIGMELAWFLQRKYSVPTWLTNLTHHWIERWVSG